MSGVFQSVRSASPGRSVFNLSYEKKFTCDMGQLIPVMCDEMVPGDKFNIGNQMIIRFQPLVAPILHEINVFCHYFFVPYRLLWTDWEKFITGGEDGTFTATLPRWTPTSNAVGSLWDYMGMPTGVTPPNRLPLDFPKRAYNFIWNSFYRDETLQTALDINVSDTILRRAWEKDYFTSSLPWQQRGIAPALPITGYTTAQFANDITIAGGNRGLQVTRNGVPSNLLTTASSGDFSVLWKSDIPTNSLTNVNPYISQPATVIPKTSLGANIVDLSSATTFNVSDLRLAFQVQKWLERNARGGARYVEFLRSHFGVSPRDDRLQRPEYIGGSKSPVIISEVLQTAGTGVTGQTTPQGNMAGHGISVNQSHCASYYAQEFGVVIGLMSVMPRTAYQQGINRQWLRQTKYDFYFPEFANLSEQAIEGPRYMHQLQRLIMFRCLVIRVGMMRCGISPTLSAVNSATLTTIGISVDNLLQSPCSMILSFSAYHEKMSLRLRPNQLLLFNSATLLRLFARYRDSLNRVLSTTIEVFMRFNTPYDRDHTPEEPNSGEIITEQQGYISSQDQIEALIMAGQRLDESRAGYEFADGEDVPEDYFDPTTQKNLDMVEAQQFLDQKKAALAEQQKIAAEKNPPSGDISKKSTQDSDPEGKKTPEQE